MNRLDSELITDSLVRAGHEMVADRKQARAVLYNTCSVRRHAEDKVLSRIGAEGKRKQSGKNIVVGIIGCMAQRRGAELARRYPQVDVICGPGQIHRLTELLAEAAAGRRVVALDPARNEPPDQQAAAGLDALDLGRDVNHTTAGVQAFVRVMRGCDRFCTYCVVPYVRGPQHSRSPDHVVEEVRRLVDAGRSEITLLGQTVNAYRWRSGGRTVSFADLLARVADVDNLRRLRFVTSHPAGFGDDILAAMRDLPNLCEYIHCPAQSGSDAVLKRMKRGYTRAQYDDFVARAREIVPGVVLAGDFIVGFPGETDADHDASADLIRTAGYKNSFIFKYSPRPGTTADGRLKDDVPLAVKKRRNNELLAVQQKVGLTHHRQYVGREVEVLTEGPSPRSGKQTGEPPAGQVQLTGRTRWDHIVIFDGPAELAGRYVRVNITDASPLTLFGRLSGDSSSSRRAM